MGWESKTTKSGVIVFENRVHKRAQKVHWVAITVIQWIHGRMNGQERTVSQLEPHEIDLQTVVCLAGLANSEKVNKMLCFQGIKTDTQKNWKNLKETNGCVRETAGRRWTKVKPSNLVDIFGPVQYIDLKIPGKPYNTNQVTSHSCLGLRQFPKLCQRMVPEGGPYRQQANGYFINQVII